MPRTHFIPASMNDTPSAPRPRMRPPAEPCLNCGDPTPGRFCPSCGQRKTEVRASVGAIVGDVVKDELVLNAALPRTVGSLLFRPGHLTEEYIRGRIVRYIPPLRLYLVSSILFFVVVSFIGLRALERVNVAHSTLPENPDSARLVLQARQAELQAVDTMELPTAARVIVRQSLRATATALDALGDTAPAGASAALARLRRAEAGQAPLPPGTLQPWALSINFDGAPRWLGSALERKLDQLGHLPARDAAGTLVSDALNFAPHTVFLLLPVFALLLKLLYIRRDRFYAEHVVFALHVHAFFFLMFLIILLLPWRRVDMVLVLWMVAYVWLAMRRVYRQGWFRTTVKWWTLGWCYFFVLSFGLAALMFSTLMLT
jgi:hypothetical protein